MKHKLFAGIDWSNSKIDVCLFNHMGDTIKKDQISTKPEALFSWVDSLCEQLEEEETIAICMEQPCQNLVNFFSQFPQLKIYLENPTVIKRYRESLSSSRAKDDKRDAAAIAQYIFERHKRLKIYQNNDPLCAQIATLGEKRRQLVGVRTSLSNKLTQALKEYFPQALELVGTNIYSKISCDFLTKWSSLQALQKARSSTIIKFYHMHNSRSKLRNEKRMQLIATSIPMCTDNQAVETYQLLVESLVKAIRQIQTSINQFDEVIEEKITTHEDYEIYISLPGAGPCFAARLLAFMGSDRANYADASELQKASGVAPITKQSGKMHFVHRRYACNKFDRQT
ncbi:MAG: transposase, partial [Planctomycetota bacterium]|nr:transposase [Planctomycetota bacterium]